MRNDKTCLYVAEKYVKARGGGVGGKLYSCLERAKSKVNTWRSFAQII